MMKDQALSRACALMACVIGLAEASGGREISSALTLASAHQEKKQEPKVSDDERQAVKKVNDATGAEAKLQAAAEFVKKYPKSALRSQVADYLADQVNGVQAPAQKISAIQTYQTIFTAPAEADAIQPILIEAYLDNKQLDESFRLAALWLEKHPEEVGMLMRLAVTGSNEAISGSTKFLPQGQQYGMKAIELIEADKRPASIEAAEWTQHKTEWLFALYREMGVTALRMGDKAAAQVRLEKAAALKTPDPSVYAILGSFADDEYGVLVNKYKSAPTPAEGDAALKKAQEQLDKVIELYAQAIALSEAKPEYKQITDQLTPALQNYYKYRHNGSTDGLQQLIDKYKK